MNLAIPSIEVVIDDLSTESGSDTLKALSKVTVAGSIIENGIITTTYNGQVELTLYDKVKAIQTLGDENPPFNYTEWSNAIFRGKASVQSGLFQVEFILPSNIIPTVGVGKISVFAVDQNNKNDATGSAQNILIGSMEPTYQPETIAPFIELFMGDDSFVEGGIVTSSTQLVANFEDDSGMNISSTSTANQMTLILDDTLSFSINEYYIAQLDNYKKGQIIFPLENLQPGTHRIRVNAWDVYNNMGTATLQFQVSESDDLRIQEFRNYPNPFNTSTTIEFQHNRSGEDLEVALTFFNLTGQTADNFTFSIPSSPYRVTLMEWEGTINNGAKLAPGLYLMRVNVRSLLDGSKNEQVSKLVIVN